jgi:putative transposase
LAPSAADGIIISAALWRQIASMVKEDLAMPEYRRTYHPGGTYFFTVNLSQRNRNDLLTRHVDYLRESVRRVRRKHPFEIHAWVVLPDHLHCVIKLPEDDADFSRRWHLIKSGFSRSLPNEKPQAAKPRRKGERGIWQRRFWEHLIRDERDYRAHMDYVHINPVRHGLVPRAADWPYSTFHRLVEKGVYPHDWAGSDVAEGLEHRE